MKIRNLAIFGMLLISSQIFASFSSCYYDQEKDEIVCPGNKPKQTEQPKPVCYTTPEGKTYCMGLK